MSPLIFKKYLQSETIFYFYFALIIFIGPCLYCRFREDIARMGRGGKDINSEEANSIIY